MQTPLSPEEAGSYQGGGQENTGGVGEEEVVGVAGKHGTPDLVYSARFIQMTCQS